ncbi:MAG TPA: acetoacetate--CoA ligase [Solirubrobacterales bacterium]|nr:acetoacetate--CoA ligase [Solirubrobacterales bacterium]
MPDSSASPEPLWEPSAEAVADSQLTAFTEWLTDTHGLEFGGYDELWEWSTDEPAAFWTAIWDYFDVVHSGGFDEAIDSMEMPGAKWFEGTRVNYAEHIFLDREPDEIAIFAAAETRDLASMTWAELRSGVAAAAAGLKALGVGPGDRVAGYLPNTPETVIAFLGAASLGAVWSSCSPDFGAGAVTDRFAQIEPKVLIAVDGYTYGGRGFDRREVVADLAAGMPTVERVVVMPYLEPDPDAGMIPNSMSWADLLATDPSAELEFTRVPFDHPLWVLYSSGTTGLPKAIVQSQGGILLEHLKKMHLHLDAQPGDRVFWFTTTGWMMWNFLVSCLLTDAAIVLYDGNPGHPDMETLWQLAADAEVTCFGTSASYISACMKAGIEPGNGRDLSRLRAVGSTGSPLAPESFDWIYEHVGSDTWLFSTSGGSDLCTAFVGGVPTLPVYRGELQARSLGAAVESWDEDGNARIGEVGELVLTKPMPSMPIYLWGDAGGSRYYDSYFDTYPGVWRHGDWIEITERGTAIIYGRSDSTINRGGIRMGTSEIYRAVLNDPAIVDALVVDIPKEGTEGWMPLFVVLAEGAELTDDLKKTVAREIRERCSPRHVPNEMIAIETIPRTLSGKVLEVPVKRILTGTPAEKAASKDSLANPTSLDFFVTYAKTLT